MRVPGCTCNHCKAEPTPDHMLLFVTTTLQVLVDRLTGYHRKQEVGPPIWIPPAANIAALLIPQIPAMWRGTIDHLEATGMPFACDNGGFIEFKPKPFLEMLENVAPMKHCHFVACPDVYNDASETLRLFEEWAPLVKEFGLPVALVCQVGMQNFELPWDMVDAIFIGGADNVAGQGWHRGEYVEQLVHEAASRGKWVHVGRVSTWRKISWCRSVGDVHSFDGSAHGRFPDLMLDKGLELGRAEHVQTRLEFTTEGET